MGFTVNRLSPVIGAEIIGADLSQPVDDEAFAALRRAWPDADGVLVLRDQHLSPEHHIAFSRRFGALEKHVLATYLLPGHPEIYRVSNKVKDGKPEGRSNAGTYWHSDLSYMRPAAMASLLYAVEIPATGGDTMFANMYAAYDGLAEDTKRRIADLHAMHDFGFAARGVFSAEHATSDQLGALPAVEHPVVRTHPETGRRVLFVNPGFTSHIAGLGTDESGALLDELFRHATDDKFVYRHKWRVRDLVMWDNRCTMHHAINDYEGIGERYMHRTTVMEAG